MAHRTGLSPALGVLLAAAALTLAAAWPVVCHPTERIFGLETVGRHHDPFTVIRQFAGAPVAAMYLQPATDWVGRAFAAVVPPVAAYNLVVLLTFPLAAWAAFLFIREVTGTTAGAAAAGLLFAFAPFHVAHAAYHPHVAQIQWIPLFLLALWRSVHGLTAWRAAGLLGAGALAVLASTYHGLVLAALTPWVALVFWLMPGNGGRRGAWRDLAGSLAVLVIAGAVVLAWVHHAVPAAFSPAVAVPPRDLVRYGARWYGYLVPPVDHPLLGGEARRFWTARGVGVGLLEQQVYVGWGVLALVVTALAVPTGSMVRRRLVWGLAAVAGMAVLCSLAPAGVPWHLPFAPPSAWFHGVAPMFRAYARFAVVVQLSLAALAGIGLVVLWSRPATRVLAVLLLAVMLFEYLPPQARSRDVLPTSGHRWLAGQGNQRVVLDCVAPSLAEGQTGWLAGFPVGYLGPQVRDCAEPGLSSKLSALGYGYLVVRTGSARQYLDRHPPAGFARAYRGADADVLRVMAEPGWYVADLRGVSRREYDDHDTWCWGGRTISAVLVNPGPDVETRTLELEVAAFGRPRHVAVSIDREVAANLVVAQQHAIYAIGPLTLAPGRHELTLESAEAPASPASLGPSRDPRRLALQVISWRTRP